MISFISETTGIVSGLIFGRGSSSKSRTMSPRTPPSPSGSRLLRAEAIFALWTMRPRRVFLTKAMLSVNCFASIDHEMRRRCSDIKLSSFVEI